MRDLSSVEPSSASVKSRGYDSPEALFRAQYVPLCRILSVFCGDQEEAADAAQEAFVQAWLKWSRVSGLEKPEAWLRRVAVNRLLNGRRSLSRRAVALLRLQPRESAVDVDGRLDLAAALRTLPARQRMAVVLRYVGDLSVAEIGEAMGVAEGTVHRHLHRGRSRLRELLGARYE